MTNKKEDIIYYCDNCEDKTKFILLYTYSFDSLEEHKTEHTFSKCKSCSRPAIFTRIVNRTGFTTDYFQLYPGSDRLLRFDLPRIVDESYNEAVRCERARIWTACVVMVGRTLEAICIEHFPQTKTIHKGLQEMFHKGHISQELLDWSNELRFLRNIGAHATKEKIKKADANESLDFLQVILEIIYHLRPKFEGRKNNKSTKNSSNEK